jgi:hypothetical protein
MSLESEFGREKYYGFKSQNKPKNGKLVFVNKDGKEEAVLMNDKPFALLNAEKMRLIREQGIFKRQLKVKYL